MQKHVFRPIKVLGLNNIVKISVGNGFILALDATGQVWGIGNNSSNVINNSRNLDIVPRPMRIADLDNIAHIAAGTNYAAAVKSDGTIWLWGQYRYKVESLNKAVEVKYIADVQKIFALRYDTVAIDKDGTGWICRGKYLKPEQITQITGIIDIIEGVNCTYAVKDDGSVWRWDMAASAAEKIEGLNNIKSITGVKEDDFIALDEEGFIWSWDYKNKTITKNTSTSSVVSIAAGASHFAALKRDNTVWAWGSNIYGQLGIGKIVDGYERLPIKSLVN